MILLLDYLLIDMNSGWQFNEQSILLNHHQKSVTNERRVDFYYFLENSCAPSLQPFLLAILIE